MPISFSYRVNGFRPPMRGRLKSWIKRIIAQEGKKTGKISFIFMNDDDLREMNREFLDHDTFTDILTFDYTEDDVLNGEIFISVDRVKENAVKFGTETENETRRVMIHGVFHLCGFNDETAKEKQAMRRRESLAIKEFWKTDLY